MRASGTEAGVGGDWATLMPQGAGLTKEKPPTRTRGSQWHFLHQHQSPGSLWKSSACPEPHPVEALLGTGNGPESPWARPWAAGTPVEGPWGWHVLQGSWQLVATSEAN